MEAIGIGQSGAIAVGERGIQRTDLAVSEGHRVRHDRADTANLASTLSVWQQLQHMNLHRKH